jgi:hypothetical protein
MQRQPKGPDYRIVVIAIAATWLGALTYFFFEMR